MKALGLEANDRAIVVHVDDLGMSIAANEGGIRAMEATATCGSVMVPCPAFEEVASVARRRSDLDLGVHLTLNAVREIRRRTRRKFAPGPRDCSMRPLAPEPLRVLELGEIGDRLPEVVTVGEGLEGQGALDLERLDARIDPGLVEERDRAAW